MTLPELHERLLSWATAAPREADLLAARADHFGRYGEPHEEDLSFERRVNAMFDFYLYEWRPAPDAPTMLRRFIAEAGSGLPAEDQATLSALVGQRRGLFEVKKLKPGLVRVVDVFTGEVLDVAERRQVAGLEKGDLLEARLLPYEGNLVFSGAFLYHPREARPLILAEARRLRKAAGKAAGTGGSLDSDAFLATLSRMAFKVERYRNVRLEAIYDFSVEARALTPRPPGRG
jgi:hypothetical protein